MPINFVGVLHMGWLRPQIIKEIRDFWTDCDAILVEAIPEPHIPKDEVEKIHTQYQSDFDNFSQGRFSVDAMLPMEIRMYQQQHSISPLKVYLWSIWRLIFQIKKPIYLETHAWEKEFSKMPRNEPYSLETIQKLICEGNRKGLYDYMMRCDLQIQKDSKIRDSRTETWLSQRSEKKWGVIFGLEHVLPSTTERHEYGNSNIRLPENQERHIISQVLLQQSSPIIDLLAPMDSFKALADETCQISNDELDKIWQALEKNAGENSSDHYQSQINRIVTDLLRLRPNLKNLWNSELESDFYKIFHLSLKTAKSYADSLVPKTAGKK